MFILELLLIIPLLLGMFVGIHSLARPEHRPNFDFWFKRRFTRREWNDLNPEEFTRRIGLFVLIVSILYGLGVVFPWFALTT